MTAAKQISGEVFEQDGRALEYVREQTHEICLAAVNQNGLALQYRTNTRDLFVNQTGYALNRVREQNTRNLFVNQCGDALNYVREQTPDGRSLRYVHEQTPEICLAAIKQNEHALQTNNKKNRFLLQHQYSSILDMMNK